MDILAYQTNSLNNIESPINLRVSIRKILQVYRMHIYIYIHLFYDRSHISFKMSVLFYQEMTWTTRQRKSVSVVLSKRLFMAYSAKINPQEIAEKVCCDEPEVQKQGSARWVGCHAKIMGDQECMCRDIRGSSKGVERNNTYHEVGIVWNFDMYNMED